MKQRKFFAWMMCCLLLVSSFSLVGCDDDDDDDNGSHPALLTAVWQYSSAVYEDTYALDSDGAYENVMALLSWEQCEPYTGTWRADDTHIYFTMTYEGFSYTDTTLYELVDDELTISWTVDGEVTSSTTYSLVDEMPTCSDYGF